MKSTSWARRTAVACGRLIAPELCVACRAPVTSSGFCPVCFQKLSLTNGSDEVAGVGTSFFAEALDDIRSAVVYDDFSRGVILRFKHADHTHAAPSLARLMAQAGRSLVGQADVLCPMPLHRWRLWRRRYNQAALLALELSGLTGTRTDLFLLRRWRATCSQAGLGRRGRRDNVRGAFAARPDCASGLSILLIDDVVTTGATLDECAFVLKKAGAARVSALVFAHAPESHRAQASAPFQTRVHHAL